MLVGVPVTNGMRSRIWKFDSSITRTEAGYAGRYSVPALAIVASIVRMKSGLIFSQGAEF
jgi:hypothetical protein